jgi:hypothetical protein
MKHAKKILCALLAMVMIVAMTAVPAFADEEEEAVDLNTLAVTESITDATGGQLSDIVTLPLVKFTVTIAAETEGTAPKETTIVYDLKGTDRTGEGKSFDFSEVKWTAPGIYNYTITSTPSNPDNGNLTFLLNGDATTTYTLQLVVYAVEGKTGEFYIAQRIIKDADGQKVDAVNFTNPTQYEKLKISNEITGNLAEKTKQFDYTLDIPVEGSPTGLTLEKDQIIKAVKYNADDEATGDTYNIIVGTPTHFTLADGEYVELEVPVSMIFTVTQNDGKDWGYTTYHDYILGTERRVTDKSSGTCDSDVSETDTVYVHTQGTIGKLDVINQVNYHNERATQIDTGIVMDVIPYVMVVMAAAALAVLMVIKKRKTDR